MKPNNEFSSSFHGQSQGQSCIAHPVQSCSQCRISRMPCGETWAFQQPSKESTMPEIVFSFASILRLYLQLDLRPEDVLAAVDDLASHADGHFEKVQRHLQSLRLNGNNTLQMMLRGAIDEMGYDADGHQQFDKGTQELYTSLTTLLVESRGPDVNLKLPLLRSPASMRVSGEFTLATIMLGNCWFFEYDPTSVPLVVNVWCSWLPARQTDTELCVDPMKHIYVGIGPYDARDELSRHNGRGVVNFALRCLIPRARRLAPLDIVTFRDVMTFRGGALVTDSIPNNNNRDLGAFMQVIGQFPSLLDPSEVEDIWSGQTIHDLGRTVLFIRQIKHIIVCLATPRSMGIVYTFLYALASPRHNENMRGVITPNLSESVTCCPSAFCDPESPSCGLDKPLSSASGDTPTNPVRLLVEAIVQEGLGAKEWQKNIDHRLRLCHEWSCGMQSHFGPFDPVGAARGVAPICVRILMRIAQLCGCDLEK
ncbi:hypothetical protein V8C35DRAFT_298165 [Trichoderma chlorosporum]